MSWWGYAAGGAAAATGIAVAVWRGALGRIDEWLRRPAPSETPAERELLDTYEDRLGEPPGSDG